jgi:hypothetical protein
MTKKFENIFQKQKRILRTRRMTHFALEKPRTSRLSENPENDGETLGLISILGAMAIVGDMGLL